MNLEISQAQTSSSCNSFPIIFRAGYFSHIDIFADYLVIVGDTDDTLLTGLPSGSRYPLIVLASIAIPDKYYWAKVLSLKVGISFRGV
jgi:hypothetical protein